MIDFRMCKHSCMAIMMMAVTPSPCRVCVTTQRGSSAVSGGRLQEQSDQGPEQGLPPPPHVVHELEEPQVERQLLLRDPAMRPQPAPQQRPEALHGVDVHLAGPIPVVVTGELPRRMADRPMGI